MGYRYHQACRYTIMHIDEFIDELLNEEVGQPALCHSILGAMMQSAL